MEFGGKRMTCCNSIVATNAGGIPYIVSSKTNVSTTAVDISLPSRRIQPVGYMTIIIDTPVPAATTATLPVTITMNGSTRRLTFANGTQVTVAALLNASIITVFNDRTRDLLVLISRTVA